MGKGILGKSSVDFQLKIEMKLLLFPFLLLLFSQALGQDDCIEEFPDGTKCSGPPKSFPDPEDCQMFYYCYRGCVTHNKCELDWLFDVAIMTCNQPEMVDCDTRPRPSTTTPATETTTTKSCGSMLPSGQNCPSNHDVGPFADPDDCASLWNCEGGCAIKSQCPPGMLLDKLGKDWQCVENSLVDCKATHRPCASEIHCSCVDTLPSPQEHVECPEDSAFDENFIPDENNCLSF